MGTKRFEEAVFSLHQGPGLDLLVGKVNWSEVGWGLGDQINLFNLV